MPAINIVSADYEHAKRARRRKLRFKHECAAAMTQLARPVRSLEESAFATTNGTENPSPLGKSQSLFAK
jgi:hypothetical protein